MLCNPKLYTNMKNTDKRKISGTKQQVVNEEGEPDLRRLTLHNVVVGDNVDVPVSRRNLFPRKEQSKAPPTFFHKTFADVCRYEDSIR